MSSDRLEQIGEKHQSLTRARIGTLTLQAIRNAEDETTVDARLTSYGLNPRNVVAMPERALSLVSARTLMIKKFAIARLEGYREEEIRSALHTEVPMGWKGRETGFPNYNLRDIISDEVKAKIKEHDDFLISEAAIKGDEQIRELLAVIKKITAGEGKSGLVPEEFFRNMHRLPPYEGSKTRAKEIIDLHSFLTAYILAMNPMANVRIAPKLNTSRASTATLVNNAFQRYLSEEAWNRLPVRVGGNYTNGKQ